MGLALHSFENGQRHYPMAFEQHTGDDPSTTAVESAGDQKNDWGVSPRLLPYIEQAVLGGEVRKAMNAGSSYSTYKINGEYLCSFRVDTLMCPSEVKDEQRFSGGVAKYYPTNIGWNRGTGQILPPKAAGCNGPFGVNLECKPAQIIDGLSNTLAAGEKKGWQPYCRDGGGLSALLDPVSETDMSGKSSTDQKGNSGNTEWCDGRTHQDGLTGMFAPLTITKVQHADDGDFTSQREGKGVAGPGYAAVTSRSYHPGTVNGLMMDGSTRSFSQTTNPAFWRAICSRAGKEVVPEE